MTQPGREQTALLSLILFVITISGLSLFKHQFASSPQLTIVGGLVSSLLFFFGILAIGNIKKEIKWPETIMCLVIAMGVAGTVHRVCVTTCFIFSSLLMWYINNASQKLTRKETSAPVSKSGGKKNN